MKKVCDAMKKSVLFWDIKEEDLERVISCFDVKLSRYDRDEFVIHQGERAKGVGLVVKMCIRDRPIRMGERAKNPFTLSVALFISTEILIRRIRVWRGSFDG